MSQTIRDSDLNLLRYIPDNILGHHLQGSKIEGSPSPQAHPFRAILLHTNILQFSQITQYMSKKYPNGLELIVDLVNKYIGILQQCLGITGGDMFKYTTDKLIFCWAAPNTNGDEYVGNLCRVILHQLLKVRDMFARELKYEEVALPVTFSVTVGNFSVVSLGGNQTGMPLEHLYGGQVFQEVLESSGLEFGNMAIVISNAVYEKVKRSFYLEEAMVHSDSEEQVKLPRLFVVKGSKEMLGYVPNVDPLYFKKEVTGGQFENIRERILSYIPPCILPYALSDTEKWGSEIRQATILAINIPLEANSLSTQSEILKLHKIIEQFQRMCKLYNTIIYRIYVDKTGLNCFIAAGLYPQSNSQISIRGVLLGVSIQQALSADNIPVYIGISTGQVIYSICGEYRKDLLLIGEPVYMSYLLSLMALKDRTKQVFVDYETKMQAEGKISFCKYVNTIFAGKVAEGIFEPVYSNEALKGIPGNSFPEIRTHHFNPDYSTNIKKQDYEDSLYMVGREDKLLRGRQFVLQFVKAPVKPNVLLITGSYGVGKTLFVRNLLENIDDMLKEKFKTNNRPSIMVSSLNPANQTKRLNGWRRIMRQVLDGLAQNLGYDRDALLNRLLEREKLSEWNSKHIREILGAPEDIWTPNKSNRENIDGTQESDSEEETYPAENDKSIVDMMVRILQYSVGEKTLFRKESDRKGEQEEYLEREKYPPLILCLDDMQDHDKLSWQLLLKVTEKVRRVCIIGVLRQDDSESERPNPLSLNDMSPTFDTQWITTCNDPYLSMDYTRKGNTRKAERERKEMMEDVLLQISTRPNMQFANYDLASLSKTEMEELIRRILEGRQISEELMQIMMERSKGNPLLGVDLLGSYLKQDMLQNMDGEWLPSDALKKFTSLGQYIEAIVPISVYKKSIEIIDSQEITRLSLLKIASAIGTTFDIKTLLLSDLLYHSILPLDALLGALDALFEQKIFKIVDRSTKNIVYKFSSSFLRETIYQLMPYAYRQKQHKIIVASWQGTKNFLEDEQVLYQLALSDTSVAFHDQYAENIRRTYVAKNVDTMFNQQTKRGEVLLKSSNAEKQSKAGDKWVSRFVVLTSTQLRYYKNQADFNDKPILPSVAIPLKNIITTEKHSIPNTTKTILQIEIAGWIKGPQENGPRSFFFAFEDDQITEEWLFSLEYLRGRAIYEDFVSNYDPRVSLQQRQTKRTLETLPASQRQPLRTRDWEGQTQEKQTNLKTSPMKTRRTDYENMGTQETAVYEEMSWTKDRTIRSPYQNRTKTSFAETEKLSPRKKASLTREQSGKERNIDVLKSFLCKGQVLLWAHTFSQAGVSVRNKEIFGDTPKLLREKDLLKSDLGPEIKTQKEVSILKTEPVFPGVPVNFTKQKREKDLSQDIMQGFKLRVKQVTEKDENSLELSYSPKKEPEGEYLLRSRETWEGEESVQNTVGDVMRYQKQVPGESIEVVKKKAREQDKKGGLSIESMLNKRLAAANVGPKEVVVRDKSGKKNKQLKPSMYGKYEFVSTFFVDSYVDDSVFESQNNGIPNTLKKRLRLTFDNVPHKGSIKILKSQQGGEITVLMDEQSKERTKESSRDKFIKLNNRLETEALAYVGNLAQPLSGLRKDNDFTDNSRWQNTVKPEHVSQAGLSMEHWREGQSLAEKSWLASPIKGRGLEESILRSPLGKSRGGEERDKKGIRNQGSSESPEIRAIVEEFKNPFKAKKPDMQSSVTRAERGKGMELRSGQSTSPIRQHTFSGRDGNVLMEGSRLSRSPLSIETSNRGKIFPQTQRSKTPTYEPSAYSIQNPMLSSIQKPPQEIQRSSRFGERNEISTSTFPPQLASRDFVNESSPLKAATPFRLEVPSSFRAKNNQSTAQGIPQERTSMASPSLHLNSNKPFYFGHTNQTISSVDGDDFTLQPGEFVVITRIFERQGLVELLWSGYTGLFPLNCVNIQKQADPQDVKKHVTIGQVPESQRNSITGSYRMTYSERESIQGDNSPLAGRSIPGSINDVNVEDRVNKAYPGSLEEKMKMGMAQRRDTENFGETSAEIGRKMPSKMMVRQMKKNQDRYEPQGEQKRNIFMS